MFADTLDDSFFCSSMEGENILKQSNGKCHVLVLSTPEEDIVEYSNVLVSLVHNLANL